ncbi:hypothetical protein ACM26E_20180 [Kluyvera cryocrescens]|uniref:hypothetical protein n=1 Tax=Kluyvera cryocrescens TaxID=580 RepID=UPI0039F5D02A
MANLFKKTIKIPRYGIIAIKYLIETRDLKGLILIANKKISNNINPEIKWFIRSEIERVKKIIYSPSVKLHFITFYTQGGKYDDGIDLSSEVDLLLRKAKPFADSVRAISAYELKSNPDTKIYVKEFEEEAIWNFKTNKIGFLRWKPYILLKELEKMNDGDILFYRDCNVTKYPNILADIHHIRKNATSVLNYINGDLFSPIEMFPNLKVKHNVKTDVLKQMGLLTEKNIESYLHNASIIICRKTPEVIKALKEWLYYCMDDQLISPNYNQVQHCEFKHNTQEQAIFNGVLIKNGYAGLNSFKRPLGLSIIDRHFSLQKLVRVPRVAILYCGQARNFDNSELLKMNFDNLLGKFNCDIFASLWDERGYSFHHGQANPSSYSRDRDLSKEKIIRLLNHSGCTVQSVEFENFDNWISNQNEVIQQLYHQGLNFGEKVVKATAFPQLYKIYKANQLKTTFEESNNFKYDLVIRMRPDMGFVEPIPDYCINEELKISNNTNNIYHLNPPKIFYPNRIYDILFWGNSENMNRMAESWININNLLEDDFDNGLPLVDCCRLLYVQALKSRINVIDVSRCIGDIYRDEDIEVYKNKILYDFN